MRPTRHLPDQDAPALETPLIRGVIAHGRRILYQVLIFPAEGAAPGVGAHWLRRSPLARREDPSGRGGGGITGTRC